MVGPAKVRGGATHPHVLNNQEKVQLGRPNGEMWRWRWSWGWWWTRSLTRWSTRRWMRKPPSWWCVKMGRGGEREDDETAKYTNQPLWLVKSVIQSLLEKWHLLADWPARPWWGFVNASNLQTTLERRYYTNHVYLKYKNHSVCGPDMSCFFIFSVFLEIRFLWWEKLQSGFSHSHRHSSKFFWSFFVFFPSSSNICVSCGWSRWSGDG